MRVDREDYQRMCDLIRKQKRASGLTEEETKELWGLKQANHKDNRDYLREEVS